MTSTPQERQAFFDWIQKNIPAIDDYFGLNHLQQFVADGLSREYDVYLNMWKNDPESVKDSFIARLTGLNPKYASFIQKAKNSGDTLRAEIAIVQNELDQTQNQVNMWQSVLNAPTTDRMKTFAQGLLSSYLAQLKQVGDTLTLYKNDLNTGLANGTYQ